MGLSKWKQEIVKLRLEQNRPWDEILDKYESYFDGLPREKIKKRLYDTVSRIRRGQETKPVFVPEEDNTKVTKNNDKQTQDSERTITVSEDQVLPDSLMAIFENKNVSDEDIMALHNMDPKRWAVVTYVNNKWHSQAKGGRRLIMYQSKLTVRPHKPNITFADIKTFFDTTDFNVLRTPIVPLQYDPDGDILEINVADLHNGMYAWFEETGADYNTTIAREFLRRAVADILGRCYGRKFKRVVLALLGDLLHTDNDKQSTTKGTLQEVDGSPTDVFTKTIEMLIETIDALTIIAPVEVVYTRGNHDFLTGWMLIKSIEMAYRFDKNVTVDVSPDTQKKRLFGISLVGFVHGSMPEKNLSGWLQVEARKMETAIKFMEVHSGHRHDIKVKERIQTDSVEGVVVRTMPALCNSTTWGHNEGLVAAMQAVVCFIWNEQTGLREQWYCTM